MRQGRAALCLTLTMLVAAPLLADAASLPVATVAMPGLGAAPASPPPASPGAGFGRIAPLAAPTAATASSVPGVVGLLPIVRAEPAAEATPRSEPGDDGARFDDARNKDAKACRHYRRTILIEGAPAQAVGTMCRTADGRWEIER